MSTPQRSTNVNGNGNTVAQPQPQQQASSSSLPSCTTSGHHDATPNPMKRASIHSSSSVSSSNCSSSNGFNASNISNNNNNNNNDDDSSPSSLSKLMSSNVDYDNIRNATLLFFLDRLYMASTEGKEARTLHDLSCLFGTKDFTKEMRQIVGASRNGLKKFLESYPSLFTIEGDKVYLTQLKQESSVPVRDYNREAVDYFRDKMAQFGTSLVPIRNLFGYRSQASQEVRHVSGKNTRDFKQFLKANEDVFELLADEEHVVLKSALRELMESNGGGDGGGVGTGGCQADSLAELQASLPPTSEDSVTMDPYLNKQFAQFVRDCLSDLSTPNNGGQQDDEQQQQQVEMRHITLECLHDKIQRDCQNELFLKMVRTLEELRIFLRMHPKLFKKYTEKTPPGDGEHEREFVRLISDEERREIEAQTYPSNFFNGSNRQHSTLVRSNTGESQLSSASNSTMDMSMRDGGCTSTTRQPKSLPPNINHRPAAAAAANVEFKSTTTSSANDRGWPKQNNQHQPVNHQTKSKLSAFKSPSFDHHHHDPAAPKSKSSQNHQHHHHQQQQQLRANAPPFVPSSSPSTTTTRSNQQHHNNGPLGQRQHSSLTPSASLSGRHHHHNHNHHQQQQAMHPRSYSNLSPSSRQDTSAARQSNELAAARQQRANKTMVQPIDQRSAIRNYLLKGNTNPANNNLYWSSGHSADLGAQSNNNNNKSNSTTITTTTTNNNNSNSNNANQKSQQQAAMIHSAGPESGDYLRARTVDIVREASNIITRIMKTTDAVAFDCKGFNLGFDGQITLIQFGFLPTLQNDSSSTEKYASNYKDNSTTTTATARGGTPTKVGVKPEVCVFDLITNPELAYCLKPLLESDKIVKIVHDVRNKSNALYVQFKIILNNVFDTQVANLVIQQQQTGKPAYKSRYISMGKLCEVYGDDELMRYRNLIKSKTRHNNSGNANGGIGSSSTQVSSSRLKDVNYWRTRPLTNPMIFEATMDVYCLVGGIYQNLQARIKPEYRPLFDQLNMEGVMARIKPDEIRSAKKERKIDLEVIDLKRKLYSDTKGTIVLSNREIRLLRHVDLSEEVRSKIQQCKKVAKKLERLDMKAAAAAAAAAAAQQQSMQSVDGSQTGEQGCSQEDESSQSPSLSPSAAVEERDHHQLDDLDEAQLMCNLMDSSMFDELKDKMIESSSLLESLEEDDNDDLVSGEHSHLSLHSHSGGSSHEHCCRCTCHSGSARKSTGGPKSEAASSDLESSANGNHSKPIYSQAMSNPHHDTQANTRAVEIGETTTEAAAVDDDRDKDREPTVLESQVHDGPSNDGEAQQQSMQQFDSVSSKSSSAVDMAIQCDLLS